jgi:hypothetical protein
MKKCEAASGEVIVIISPPPWPQRNQCIVPAGRWPRVPGSKLDHLLKLGGGDLGHKLLDAMLGQQQTAAMTVSDMPSQRPNTHRLDEKKSVSEAIRHGGIYSRSRSDASVEVSIERPFAVARRRVFTQLKERQGQPLSRTGRFHLETGAA